MLMSLLPGLRDLRTPLAVGYLWLFLAWLVWGPLIPAESQATGTVARAYGFIDLFSAAGGLAVISFLSYLLGCVLSLQWFIQILYRVVTNPFRENDALGTLIVTEQEVTELIDKFVYDHILRQNDPEGYVRELSEGESEGSASRQSILSSGLVIRKAKYRYDTLSDGDLRYLEAVIKLQLRDEFQELTMRLQLHDKSSLYDSFDRKTAESEFRLAIALPLSAIIVSIATIQGWLALLALIVPTVLCVQGIRRGTEARTEVYQTLLADEIRSKTISSIPEQLDKVAAVGAGRIAQRKKTLRPPP